MNLLFTYRILDIAAIVEDPELPLTDRQSHNTRGDFKLNVSPFSCQIDFGYFS